MARLWPYSLTLGIAPLLASCVFLLDYDELQKPAETSTGGQAGSGMAGAPAGGAGGAGGAPSCGECDDSDPCTTDSCDDAADPPECLHEPAVGLQLDGLDQTIEGEQHVRVSMAAGSDAFYLAVLEAVNDVPDVTLYRLMADGTELEPYGEKVSEIIPLEGNIVSNVGLAVDPTLGGLSVHGFVAFKPRLGDVEPKVFHLVNRMGNTTASLVPGSSYRPVSPWVFPQALAINKKVVGAWIQADGTIGVHDIVGTGIDTFGTPTLPATTLSLLSTSDDKPAVMYTAQSDTASLGTYVETGAQNRSKVVECQTGSGTYLSSSAIATQLPGIWLGNVTKAGDDFLTTGGATLVCASGGCTPVTEACEPADQSNGIRNIAGGTVRFDSDPPGIIYTVLALPQLAPKSEADPTYQAKLSLALGKVDFSNDNQAESTQIGGDEDTHLTQIARMDTGEELDFGGPDWPAVGILPGKQVAVSWIQPNADATGTELHVQRYRMCLPEE